MIRRDSNTHLTPLFNTAPPMFKHLSQAFQAAMVEVKDLVLTLLASDDKLTAGAVLTAKENPQRPHLAQVH